MKLTNLTIYPGGWCLDILKFKKRSIIELSGEETTYKTLPSLFIQIGPNEILDVCLGLVFCNLSLRVWSRHFDD